MSCHVMSIVPGFGFTFGYVEPLENLTVFAFEISSQVRKLASSSVWWMWLGPPTHTKSTHETPGEVYLEDHPRTRKWLRTMVRAVGLFQMPNGRFMAFLNKGY